MLKRTAFLFSLFILIASCEKKTTSDGVPGAAATNFSAKINGMTFPMPGTPTAVAIYMDTAKASSALLIGLQYLSADGNRLENIYLSCSTNDSTRIKVGDVFKRSNYTVGNTYHLGIGEYSDTYLSPQSVLLAQSDSLCMVRITKHDQVAQTFSGEFAFTAVDNSTNTTYEITEGVFTDISYD